MRCWPGVRQSVRPDQPVSRREHRDVSWLANPRRRFAVLTLSLSVLLAAAIDAIVPQLGPLASWLIAITLVSCSAYGYDKLVAGSSRTRVPEQVLLALALAGGTAGALAAMVLFRHKTSKRTFQLQLLAVVLVQAMLIAVYCLYLRPLVVGGR